MSAIPASTYTSRVLVDGTLALTVHIDPKDRLAAQTIFSAPGTPCALAALRVGAEVSPEPEKPKGGPLAKLAGQWCNDPEFWAWLETDPLNAAHSPEGAAACVYAMCGIKSRVELDHNEYAATRFEVLIRQPYMAHMAGE